ncbi:MAG: ATP-binding protein [bacterium]|nr:ATP-binding protein [bacterium]
MIIGRTKEIKRLQRTLSAEYSEFVAVYGRRRVGKTFLIKEAFDYKFAFQHSGIAHGNKRMQLEEFTNSLERQGMKSRRKIKSWSDAFFSLEVGLERLPEGKKVVFLDELPWMDTAKSNFVSALDHFWNGWCSFRKDIVLVVCGSATSWIVGKILKNRGGLHNRLTDQMHLQPFTLAECEQMVHAKGLPLSRQQVLEGYMVLGGVPFYWEKLEKSQSLDQNIDRLFFGLDAPLFDEFDQLYASLFKNPTMHTSIVTALGEKKIGMTREEIVSETGLENCGALSLALDELETCGFIRSYTVPGRRVKGSVYQLIDNFSLFYFKFMVHGARVRSGSWLSKVASQERRVWNGLSFELVCLEHIGQIKRALGIAGIQTTEHAWRRKGTVDREGAQIDLLIHRADNAVNICEMKYSTAAYEISDAEGEKLRHRREAYVEDEQFKGSAFVTMVSPYGVVQNAQWNNIQSEVTLEDLFQT